MGGATKMKVTTGGAEGGGSNGRAAASRGDAARRRRRTDPVDEVRELFRDEVEAAKKRLVELLQSETEKTALDAANAILDRVFGKPRQVPEPAEEKRSLPPIRYYEVETGARSEADTPRTDWDGEYS